MKSLSRIKIGTVLVLILSGFLGLALITSCGGGEGTKATSSSSGGDGRSDGDNDGVGEITIDCSLDSEGDTCSDSSSCRNLCDDELELSGDALDECEKLGEDTVKDLVELFYDDLTKPTQDKLDSLKLDDIELMCGAVRKLGEEILEEKIEDYTTSPAKRFLAWMAEKDEVLDIWKAIELKGEEEEERKPREDAVDILRTLIHRAGGGSKSDDDISDTELLTGLKAGLDDNSRSFLEIAQRANNVELIKYVHKELIDNDDQLCKEENYPTAIPGKSGAGERTDGEDACVLGVYCKIAPPSASKSQKIREEISQIVDADFISLVKSPLLEGGLGLSEDDAEEWTNNACHCLVDFWQASTNSGALDVITDAGTSASCN